MKTKFQLSLHPVISALLVFLLLSGAIVFTLWQEAGKEPLYVSIEEDPSFGEDGVFRIYNKKDYLRFNGYLNRAWTEERENETAFLVDAELMADLDLEKDDEYLNLKGHPYIKDSILRYGGTFEGNGHTIIWYEDREFGMFSSVLREAEIRNLNFRADIDSTMDAYGVGMLCVVNYGSIVNCAVEGRIEGDACYVGGIAGMNRGTIENCINRAEVELKGTGDYGAGGIAGVSKSRVLKGEKEENPVPAVIQSCRNLGSVKAPWEAGGICAYNDCASIYDCINEGAVTVQYQKVNIDPENPDCYENARAAGICGYMGGDTIKDCCNTGKISILEEGTYCTYGIAGNTPNRYSTVTGCVSLKGAAAGQMRYESIMELNKEELALWQKDHDSIAYVPNSWQFNLDEAKKKLPLVPLSVTQSELTSDKKDVFLCRDFLMQAPEGYRITEVSPYALCMEWDPLPAEEERSEDKKLPDGRKPAEREERSEDKKLPDGRKPAEKEERSEDKKLPDGRKPAEREERSDKKEPPENGCQVWLLRLKGGLVDMEDCLEKDGTVSNGTADKVNQSIRGLDWLHPGFGYRVDNHVYRYFGKRRELTGLVNYRDDDYVDKAVQENGRKIDNVAALPLGRNSRGEYEVQWLLLFTDQNSSYCPPQSFVDQTLKGFSCRPIEIKAEAGDSLSAISLEYTGDNTRYMELAEYNRLEDANRLEEGQTLVIPDDWLAVMPGSQF